MREYILESFPQHFVWIYLMASWEECKLYYSKREFFLLLLLLFALFFFDFFFGSYYSSLYATCSEITIILLDGSPSLFSEKIGPLNCEKMTFSRLAGNIFDVRHMICVESAIFVGKTWKNPSAVFFLLKKKGNGRGKMINIRNKENFIGK